MSASDANQRLAEAVRRGDLEAARRALDEGADPNYVENEWTRHTPVLFTACADGNAALVELLLERGADPDVDEHVIEQRHSSWEEQQRWAPYEGSEGGAREGTITPCLEAALPDLGIMKALLEKDADPNACVISWIGTGVSTRRHVLRSERATPEARRLLEFYGARERIRRKPRAWRTPFRPREHAPFEQEGTAVVSGLAAAQTPDGELVVAAGKTVWLMPATSYFTEWWRREVQGGRPLADPDPRTARSERRVTADEHGRFRFEKVPEGNYYVCCRLRLRRSQPLQLSPTVHVEGVHQKVYVGARITVRSGDTIEVDLARIEQRP
ncbi:MAG: hypothetical protein HYV08_04870 [Deltaproteobacteria bacterium]|nr:hypothetical protein [Deltaproteobacteria bacterium]